MQNQERLAVQSKGSHLVFFVDTLSRRAENVYSTVSIYLLQPDLSLLATKKFNTRTSRCNR
jgi:hypothetical protein